MKPLTVWKFELPISDRARIDMPIGATILLVAAQGNVLCLWAKLDPGAPRETRTFYISGTGNPAPELVDHVGSAVVPPFVWHVWEAT